jgi:hypothetical protein
MDMVTWLFDSKGEPVAYVSKGWTYTIFGSYLGKLEAKELWNRAYLGEVVNGDRLFYRLSLKVKWISFARQLTG